jgi:hypothetical protein
LWQKRWSQSYYSELTDIAIILKKR